MIIAHDARLFFCRALSIRRASRTELEDAHVTCFELFIRYVRRLMSPAIACCRTRSRPARTSGAKKGVERQACLGQSCCTRPLQT